MTKDNEPVILDDYENETGLYQKSPHPLSPAGLKAWLLDNRRSK
ncbi:hypothetical protein [Curtobacterium sp. MCBA15_009]|nr:hypothetical protein [Curtobacterium sp. MCBA15_009]